MTPKKRVSRIPAVVAILCAALSALALSACKMRDGANRIAFVYGISIYLEGLEEGTGNNLELCDDDAVGMAQLLAASGYEVHSRISGATGDTLDAYPTRENILSDIASVPEGTDRVVFYYSGHGFRNNYGEGVEDYLVPYGALDSTSHVVPGELIGAAEWQALMANCLAPQKICIFDSCYSGGFAYAEGELDLCPPIFGPDDEYGQEPSPTLLDPMLLTPILVRFMAGRENPSNALVLSAAGSMEFSWERGDHGIFTGALLESIDPYEGSVGSRARADTDGDGAISVVEAYAYAALKVKYTWNEADGTNYSDAGQVADFHPHLASGPLDAILFSY